MAGEGVPVDAVFGVSMTPSTVGLVLVGGWEADGATIDHDTFDMQADSGELIAEAVTRIEAAAANQGHRVREIAVTWTADTDADAAVLLKELAAAGFDNVKPVRLLRATEALAREIAGVVGFDTTAVCIIERDGVFVVTVNSVVGSIQTSVNQVVTEDDALVDWLGVVFATATRRPEALVVLGSTGDLDEKLPKLQDALQVPVFTPTEARQPLARGAALASARRGRSAAAEGRSDPPARTPWPRRLRIAPAAVLAGAAATVVGVGALAVGLQLFPKDALPAAPEPMTNTSDTSGTSDPVPASEAPAPPLSVVAPETIVEPSAAQEPEPAQDPEKVARYVQRPPENQPALTPPSTVPAPQADPIEQPPGEVPPPPPEQQEAPPPPAEPPQEIHQQMLPGEPVLDPPTVQGPGPLDAPPPPVPDEMPGQQVPPPAP